MKLTGVAAAGLVALVSIAAAAPAHAGAAVKAHLECTPAGGKLLKATQKAVLDQDVICAIVVDGGAVAAGATVDVTSTVTTPAGPIFRQPHAGTASADGKRYESAPFKAGSDFVGCAPVVFEGAIVADKKPLWKSAVTITPPCAAPKPTTAKLVCTADTDQGILKFPGNGDTVKADLSSGLTCTVSWKPDAGGDTPKWGALNVHGSGKPAELRPLAAAPGATTMIAFAQFIQPVVPACKPFVVDAVLLRSDGAAVATLKQPIVQACAKK